MAITQKPSRVKPADPVMAFVEKGGSVALAIPEPKGKGTPVQHPLKFPADGELFNRLERARSAATVKLPRNTWVLQAIAEKLEREGL